MTCLANFFIGVLRFQGLVDLMAQAIQNVPRRTRDIGLFHVARLRQVHRKFLLHPPGAKRQQRHAISQPYRFADIVVTKMMVQPVSAQMRSLPSIPMLLIDIIENVSALPKPKFLALSRPCDFSKLQMGVGLKEGVAVQGFALWECGGYLPDAAFGIGPASAQAKNLDRDVIRPAAFARH